MSASALCSSRATVSPPKPPPMTTTRRRPRPVSGATGCLLLTGGRTHPVEQVIAYPHGVRHRGQRRVDGADAGEEARVDDVEGVDLVHLAAHMQHRGGR